MSEKNNPEPSKKPVENIASRGHAQTARRALWEKRLALEARYKRRRRPVWGTVMAAGLEVCLRCAGLWRRGRRNAARPVLRYETFTLSRLPSAFDGFRILLLSDFHARQSSDELENLEVLLKPVTVDLCVMVGDYRFNSAAPGEWACHYLDNLLPFIDSREGTMGVLGNNDTSEFVEEFESRGVKMLVNEGFALTRQGMSIWIGGVDDPEKFRTDSVAEAVCGRPQRMFTILSAHSPAAFRDAANCNVDLYLCGHTHGGQIRSRRGKVLGFNTRAPRETCRGQWSYCGMDGFTSAGLGTTAVPVRFNCPPEAVCIELRCATI